MRSNKAASTMGHLFNGITHFKWHHSTNESDAMNDKMKEKTTKIVFSSVDRKLCNQKISQNCWDEKKRQHESIH